MKIKPFKNRILLKCLEQKSKHGIILPDNVKPGDFWGFIDRGEIVAMGKDVDKKEFKIGNKVIFKRAEALHVKLSGKDSEKEFGETEKYMLVEDQFITCKIKE